MYSKETKTEDFKPVRKRHDSNDGRVISGIILVVVGLAFLARKSGLDLPNWLFSWPMFLILLGIFLGAKHNFRRGGWWIVSLVGAVFLTERFVPGIQIGQYFWPVAIIIIGLVFIFKPRSKWKAEFWKEKWNFDNAPGGNASRTDDYMDSTSIFGSVKKNIISKDFKGGEMVCIFGGAEINLMQADIQGRVELEVVQIFGGTKLLVPAHWEVVPEMVAILGGIEDKRPANVDKAADSQKVLVLRGTSIFGGIDIRSY